MIVDDRRVRDLRYTKQYMNIRQHRRVWYILAIGLLLLGFGVWGVLVLLTSTPRYNNLDAVERQAHNAVILPSTLPRDATIINHPAYDAATGSIVTRVTIGDSSVTFTQQKRPQTDLMQIDTEDRFLVNAGSVYILKGEPGRLQAIVETSSSWLMVNADAELGLATFKELLESLATL